GDSPWPAATPPDPGGHGRQLRAGAGPGHRAGLAVAREPARDSARADGRCGGCLSPVCRCRRASGRCVGGAAPYGIGAVVAHAFRQRRCGAGSARAGLCAARRAAAFHTGRRGSDAGLQRCRRRAYRPVSASAQRADAHRRTARWPSTGAVLGRRRDRVCAGRPGDADTHAHDRAVAAQPGM
ncbi:hypothetical protein XPN_1514, partial [Xanthomonas arboricola pv. pruni MAFF 301427]